MLVAKDQTHVQRGSVANTPLRRHAETALRGGALEGTERVGLVGVEVVVLDAGLALAAHERNAGVVVVQQHRQARIRVQVLLKHTAKKSW